MTSSTPEPTSHTSVMLQERLEASGKTPEEFADALVVPPAYIQDLLSGKRILPPPSRTDLYPKITTFFKLGRGELEKWTSADSAEEDSSDGSAPPKAICDRLLALCEPETAKKLRGRGNKDAKKELVNYFERILQAARRAAYRVLSDQTALRIAADRDGQTLAARRLDILDFLDTSAANLTVAQIERFVEPCLASWDVDIETGVLRVFMQP